jgi:membrane protein
MLAYLHVPIGWKEIFRRSYQESMQDNIFDLAAQQAYYFFFALFPALLFLISIASFFPLHTLVPDVIDMLGRIAPREVIEIINKQLFDLSGRNSGGILTLAFLFTLWSTSGAIVSIITTLNAAYDITESRPWWKVRLTAIVLTFGISLFILTSMFLILAGPTVAQHLADRFYLGPAFKYAWLILQWPVVFAFIATAIALIYYFAPDAEQDWVWITPGSVVATLLWVAVSLGLKLYYTLAPNANATYGAIGGVMVLMLWFYLSGLAMLLGAELNSEIEHASPYGKEPGERVPGEKKVIGARARRIWEEKRERGETPVPAIPARVNCDIETAPPLQEPSLRPSDILIGTIALVPVAITVGLKVKGDVQEKLKKTDLKKTA